MKECQEAVREVVNKMVSAEEIEEDTGTWILLKEKEFRIARYYASWKTNKFKAPMT